MGHAERRQILERIVPGQVAPLWLPEAIAGGTKLLKHACVMGLEGIITKHREAPYTSGRGGAWLKIKCTQGESFAVIGYEPSTLPGFIGGLVLAARKGDELIHVGSVGTGFSHKVAREFKTQLDATKIDRPVARGTSRKLVPVPPTRVAKIEFRVGPATTSCGMPHSRGFARRRMRRTSASSRPDVWRQTKSPAGAGATRRGN